MSEVNRFGLSRYIPEDIRRKVRRNAGFGCVRCGTALIEYDHVDPEFVDATEHRVEGIAALCGTCHRQRTSGRLSRETVLGAMQAPAAFAQGVGREAMDIGTSHPTIRFGSVEATRCRNILVIDDVPVLSINPPEEAGAPFRISACVKDSAGNTVLEIVDNEIQVSTVAWDFKTRGPRSYLEADSGRARLFIFHQPPRALVIEKFDWPFGRFRVVADGKSLKAISGTQVIEISGARVSDAETAVAIEGGAIVVGKGGTTSVDSLAVYDSTRGPPVRPDDRRQSPQRKGQTRPLTRDLLLASTYLTDVDRLVRRK